MIKFFKRFFQSDLSEERNDEFIWMLAEALFWRDEEVSIVAIPHSIKKQTFAKKYYDDAKYLIDFVNEKIEQPPTETV